ncbi:MAG TPA: glycosyltransferase family 39 protein [Anaerolineales bacterium]|nr:glycosyltransferase family 39 protein [Anaerolineales bacterium]
MNDKDSLSVLDHLKSKIILWRGRSVPAEQSRAARLDQKHPDRSETATKSELRSPAKLFNRSRSLLLLSLALTGYVLFNLPRMASDANFGLVSLFWLLAFVSYTLALTEPLSIRQIDWNNWWISSRWTIVTFSAILVVAFLVRFWHVESIPFVLSGDEASHGLDAMGVIHGEIRNPFATRWSSVPTMTFFVLSLPLRLLGQSVFALRLTAVLIGSVTVLLVFLLVNRLKGPYFALAVSALVAAYHYHIHFSRLGANMVFDPFFGVLALFFLHRAMDRRQNLDWIMAGAASAFAFYFYAGARFVLVLVFAVLAYSFLLEGQGFFRRNWRGILILAGAFLIVAAPMLQYALRFPDEFNARINQVGIIQSGWLEQEVDKTGSSMIHILWDQFRRAALAFNYYPDRTVWYGLRQPLLDPVFGALFLAGLGFATLRSFLPGADKNLFFMVAWWWGAILLGGVLTESPPSSMRLVTLSIPVCFFIVLALSQLFDMLKKSFTALPVHALMTIGVFSFAWISLNTYFSDFTPKRIAGGPDAELATLTAPVLREFSPHYRILFVGAPRMYWGFSTNPFLVPDADAEDIIEPLTAAPDPGLIPPGRGAVFVVVPERMHELNFILEVFPRGELREFHSDSEWNTTVTLFIVPPE